MSRLYSLLLLLSIVAFSSAFRTQAVAVKGKLMCGDKPASGVLVKLFDEDDGLSDGTTTDSTRLGCILAKCVLSVAPLDGIVSGPDPDDVLQSMTTGPDGTFSLQGSAMELTPIDPEVRIYHDCNDYGKPCQREWIIRVPNKYIYSGTVAGKAMDLGTMNLEVELEAESQSCLH
ncbi:ttr-36 [Pristionchus pacificus]|uniref:Ttr-36 n=1 Tax=Pristionchus pacificus TaxID=54126 RepID=A0A2A6CUD8_PRIPA|nr:ttr-36 [Pristionchus pacificus]|eukprot:PDM81728.1 ttr-36 [Pristionchus pacificus]